MLLAQDISSLALSLRKKVNIKVRQPLQRILIPVLDGTMKDQIGKVEELIRNEVNIKQIEYLIDSEGFIKKKIKANFKLLGARLGGKMKAAAARIQTMSQAEINEIEKSGVFSILIDNEELTIKYSEVEIIAEDIPGWSVANKENLTVALDINISPELEEEGIAREFVNRIQKVRKETGLDVTDHINVNIVGVVGINNAIIHYNDYICAEILADTIKIVSDVDNGIEIEVNEAKIIISISKQ
jgi:isoleucyl-tRNA synthetase